MPLFRSGKPHCHLTQLTDPTQAAGPQNVIFDGIREDPVGQADGPPASSITIERDGLYLVTFGVGRAAVATSSSIDALVRLGGTTIFGSIAPAATSSRFVSGARTLFLNAGEVLDLRATLHSSATAAFLGRLTYLCVDRIGPVRWT